MFEFCNIIHFFHAGNRKANERHLLRELFYIDVPFTCGSSLECVGAYTATKGRWDIKCSGGKQEITCNDNENKTKYDRHNDPESSWTQVKCIGSTKLVMYLNESQMNR